MGDGFDIGAWLRALGLERYEPAFRGNDIDADLLPSLTAEELRDIGVASVGHRRRLLDAIAALRTCTERAADAQLQPRDRRQEPSPPVLPRVERRQVSVLFADLVGSTALARKLDPEELREILRAYEGAVVDEVARLGGHAAKFAGDGVLAFFGWPRAHEDDAERAIRAGLAIVEAVGRLTAPGGAPLAVRVGIATGPVVVGELQGQGGTREDVVGETPNLAARLQALAEPGGVAIAPSTHRLAGGLFECADLGRHDIKGFADPVRAWRVLGPGRAAGRFDAREAAAGGLTPLVGREEELALLLHRWELAHGGEGQAVLLSGEPGIGKSRLVRALRDRLAGGPHAALRYQCSPHHANTALQPVVEQLARASGFRRGDAAEARLAKLEALLAQSAADVRAAVPLLADLLAVPTEGRYPPLDLAPPRRRELTLRTLVDQLAGLAARRPVLVVLEDAHWADPTTLELFGLAIDRARDLPALILVTFRPGFAPPWTDRVHATALALNRLGRRQAAGIVGLVAGSSTLPAEVVEPIVARADGVPLFIEELTKAVLEGGLLRDEGGRYKLARPLPQLAVPDTLQASLLARLDQLASARRVAQAAAVIGREFGPGLLAAVADVPDDRLAEALDDLVASGLLLRQGFPPEAGYAFKHALVRDAAYETLLRGERRRLHARIVEALQDHVPEQAGAQPELLAHHCAEAGLLDQAIAHRHEAGRRAMARSAMAEAVAQFTQALDLLGDLPAGPGRDRQEFDLQIALGGAFVASRGPAVPEVGRAYERAWQLCAGEAESSPLLAALSGLFTFRLHAAGVDAAIGTAEEMLRIAEGRQDIATLAACHRCMGTGLLFRGRPARAQAEHERALSLYDRADHASPVFLWSFGLGVACLNFTSLTLQLQGHPDRALARSRDGLAAATELGNPFSSSHALHVSCWLHQIRGEPWAVRERTRVMMPLTAEHGFSNWSATAEMFHGWALAAGEEEEGAMAAGIARMRRFLALEHDRGKLLMVPHVLGLLAGALTRAGEHAEALGLIDEALARLETFQVRWCEAELHRLRGEAVLALSCERAAEAGADHGRALAIAREQGARHWELRAATSLGRLWAGGGERRKAHDLLAPVYCEFTEGFETADLTEAKALLDALR